MWILAFWGGTLLVANAAVLLPPICTVIIACASLICFGFAYYLRKWRYSYLLIASGALGCGIVWATIYGMQVVNRRLPNNLIGRNLVVNCKITDLPINYQQRTTFVATIVGEKSLPSNFKVRLFWYYPPEDLNLVPGDEWQMTVRLKPPHGLMNPGGNDTELMMFVQGIRAEGYVVNKVPAVLIKRASGWFNLNKWRWYFIKRLKAILPPDQISALIIALVTGFSGGMEQASWTLFRNTGINHLVAISGLHIGLVAGILIWLIGFGWRRSRWLMSRLPAQHAGIIGGTIGAIFYAFLSGFAIPVQRALIMLLVFSYHSLRYRRSNHWHALLVALFLVLILQPFSSLLKGFWLSFGAVAIILYLKLPYVVTWKQKLWQIIYLQLALNWGLMPFLLQFFRQISLTALGVNLLALLWICPLVVPLSFLGTVTLLLGFSVAGEVILHGSYLIFAPFWKLLNWVNNSYNCIWHQTIYHWYLFPLLLGGELLLFAPRGIKRRYLGLFSLLPLCFGSVPHPTKPGEVWFTALDVGQGLATVIRTQNHSLIYDTGASWGGNDMGKRVVIPYLDYMGIRSVDLLMISHGDNDHSGGAKSIVTTVLVNKVLTSNPERLNISAQKCYAGQNWEWDGVTFQVLSPKRHDLEKLGINDASCVLKVSSGKNTILLPGDVEKVAENGLLGQINSNLASRILLAPHHGSRTSSSEAFIRKVAPDYVIFSAGYRNRYHFPHPMIVERYRRLGAEIYNTANTGAVTFKFDAETLVPPELYRVKMKRFWHEER